MNNTGNGQVPQKLLEAQRVLNKRQAPLQELDAQIAKLQQQLSTAKQDVARAEQANSDAASAYTDEESDKNSARLTKTADDVDICRAKVKELQRRLDAHQAQRVPLDAAIQQASTVLSQVTTEVRREVRMHEMEMAKSKWAAAEQSALEWRRRYNALYEEDRDELRRQNEADQRMNQIRMREQFLKLNPPSPGIERVRH